VEVADGCQAPSKGAGSSPRVASSARKPHTAPGEAGSAVKPCPAHQHSNTRQSLPYAASVVLTLLARAKSAASSSVAASSAGGAGRSSGTSAFSIAATSQNNRHRQLR
jgi:hypothetical protein